MIGRFRRFTAVLSWPVGVLARNSPAGPVDDGHMMDGYGHMMGPWGAGAFLGLILLLVLGALVYFLVKVLGAGGGRQASEETPMDILKKRYARGEITREQFHEMKKDL